MIIIMTFFIIIISSNIIDMRKNIPENCGKMSFRIQGEIILKLMHKILQ